MNPFRAQQHRGWAGLRRRDWAWCAVALLPVLGWDALGQDLPLMHHWANAQGFALQHDFWLSQVLHTRGQQAAWLVYLALICMVLWPQGPWRQLQRRQRAASVLAITACLIGINIFKHLSLTSCPWDLQAFGGTAQYVWHWSWGQPDGGPGKCFPSGHASAAFAFVAASLPFLEAAQHELHQLGVRMVAGVCAVGGQFALTQTLRGAHYISHSLWSAWLCAVIGLVVYRWASRPPSRSR